MFNYGAESPQVWVLNPCRFCYLFLYSGKTSRGDPAVHLGFVGPAFLGPLSPWLSVTLAIESCNRFWPPKSVILSGQSGAVMSCLGHEPVPSPHMGPHPSWSGQLNTQCLAHSERSINLAAFPVSLPGPQRGISKLENTTMVLGSPSKIHGESRGRWVDMSFQTAVSLRKMTTLGFTARLPMLMNHNKISYGINDF